MKIAIVHDWLTNMGGAENLIINLHELFPEAPIYTSFYNPEKLAPALQNIDVRTSFLQKKKMVTNHQKYYPLMPLAFEAFDLSEYDVVLSSSTCCAKGVITGANTLHICYCNTPMRYAWEFKDAYMRTYSPLKRKAVSLLLHYMRLWDRMSADRVDYFIGNSDAVCRRIEKHYRRKAVTIHPAVRTALFSASETPKEYYLFLSRLVDYKRADLAIEACQRLNKKLVIVGEGPQRPYLESLAGAQVTFAGRVSDEAIKQYYAEAKALLFPGEEDFGIAAVEAMASGRPVIAYDAGGARDTVIEGITGTRFPEQTVTSLCEAIQRCERMTFDSNEIIAFSRKFDEAKFKKRIMDFVNEKYQIFLEAGKSHQRYEEDI